EVSVPGFWFPLVLLFVVLLPTLLVCPSVSGLTYGSDIQFQPIYPAVPDTAPRLRFPGKNSAGGIFRWARADYHPAGRSPSSHSESRGADRTSRRSESIRRNECRPSLSR